MGHGMNSELSAEIDSQRMYNMFVEYLTILLLFGQ